jgi:hypothetical protein
VWGAHVLALGRKSVGVGSSDPCDLMRLMLGWLSHPLLSACGRADVGRLFRRIAGGLGRACCLDYHAGAGVGGGDQDEVGGEQHGSA